MPDVTPVDAVSPLALSVVAGSDQKQLAVQAQRYALADYALKVCGLARPGNENCAGQQAGDFHVDGDKVTQMKDVVRTRGVKKRLEDDFDLKPGDGEGVPETESEDAFVGRAIVQLRRADVKDVIKLFDRVEKNNRKAAANDVAFKSKREHYRKKVAADENEEQAEDVLLGTVHRGSPEEYAEFEDWCAQFEYRDGEKDFSPVAGHDVTRGEALKPDDGTFAGYDLAVIRDALNYFKANSQAGADQEGNSADAVKTEPSRSERPDANVIKAELAKWSPAFVVSAYRRLSLIKHPDKESGSPEAFQELTDHTKVLTEACAKFHGIVIKKGLSVKKNGSHPNARSAQKVAKVAICAELPEHLKAALAFFGFTEESFRISSQAEIKKTRLVLSAEKARRDKQIMTEKELEKLLQLLREAQPSQEEQGEEEADDLGEKKTLKQLKSRCTGLCKTHYTALYGYLQKLK